MLESNVELLNKLVSTNKLPQSILLSGSIEIDLLEYAKYLAKSLLCHVNPCLTCRFCLGIDRNTIDGYYLIDADMFIKKEEIEMAVDNLSYSNIHNKDGIRILLINNIEQIERTSLHQLLKVIEEPQKNVYIITTSHHKDLILPTINSRLVEIMMKRGDKEKLIKSALDQDMDKNVITLLTESFASLALLGINHNSPFYKFIFKAVPELFDKANMAGDQLLSYGLKEFKYTFKEVGLTVNNIRIFIRYIYLFLSDYLMLKTGHHYINFTEAIDILERMTLTGDDLYIIVTKISEIEHDLLSYPNLDLILNRIILVLHKEDYGTLLNTD